MVQAWYMDNSTEDQRLQHHRTPPKFIDMNELFKRTGVEYFKVSHIHICIFFFLFNFIYV